jgi:Flp pilus assembly secretin CpaC
MAVVRQGVDAAPVASLVDGMRGNDAAIKLVVGQGRLLTLKTDIAAKDGSALIATGDPSVVDFAVLPNPRMIRLLGKRPGITDLSVVCTDGQVFGFEVHVQYDLELVAAHLRQAFPNDALRLSQLRNVVVVEAKHAALWKWATWYA